MEDGAGRGLSHAEFLGGCVHASGKSDSCVGHHSNESFKTRLIARFASESMEAFSLGTRGGMREEVFHLLDEFFSA